MHYLIALMYSFSEHIIKYCPNDFLNFGSGQIINKEVLTKIDLKA